MIGIVGSAVSCFIYAIQDIKYCSFDSIDDIQMTSRDHVIP